MIVLSYTNIPHVHSSVYKFKGQHAITSVSGVKTKNNTHAYLHPLPTWKAATLLPCCTGHSCIHSMKKERERDSLPPQGAEHHT